ncbi:hypothetical protein [Chromohalobacter canadensis]|uniref:Uncharacterized protein n=1 Tax=Chromohalobacter canadensis TaxID=141389 RepID=A0A285VDF8_9GAMM|nr:hypothetical protein [Chromohalobacter canadensis]MCK0769365.1 hypothetical protein [Chromohalobacter canadensis]WQH10580.1 hypothetical protein SR908_07880 [Chromohalobacter canadensis]SOC51106.1 hypothetical protein SAMN05421509_101139 [Chromohalobacter canadensis]
MAGEVFDLSHLHPYETEYVVPAKGSNPERRFKVSVSFGLHCFTKTSDDVAAVPDDGWYADNRERRAFCHERWKLSKMLPGIIETLDSRKCLHTGREEFITIEVVVDGRQFDYAVFFLVTKGGKSGADLNLFVISAHERYNALRYKKPIRFHVILMNRYQGKPIKVPR